MPNRPSALYCYCPERHVDINTNIIKAFGEEVAKEICINPDGVAMPKPFGRIYVAGIKHEGKPMDYNSTKLYGKPIYHTNDETDGYVFRAITKLKAFRLTFFYGLKPNAMVKRLINKTIKEGNWQHWGQYKSLKDTRP